MYLDTYYRIYPDTYYWIYPCTYFWINLDITGYIWKLLDISLNY